MLENTIDSNANPTALAFISTLLKCPGNYKAGGAKNHDSRTDSGLSFYRKKLGRRRYGVPPKWDNCDSSIRVDACGARVSGNSRRPGYGRDGRSRAWRENYDCECRHQ